MPAPGGTGDGSRDTVPPMKVVTGVGGWPKAALSGARRAEVSRFGDDQDAIEHPRMRLRLGHREDRDHLIRIGQDDLLDIFGAAS